MTTTLSNGVVLLGPAATDVSIRQGTGSPEGSVTAPPGSNYLDKNGLLWVKSRGTGNTGWSRSPDQTGYLGTTNWYYQPHSSVTTQAFSANQCIFAPVYIPHALTISQIGAEVTAAGVTGAPTIRFGVYAINTTDGTPGTLLKDCGAVACTSIAPITTTSAQAIALPAGWVFFALAAQGATGTQPTLRAIGNGAPMPWLNSMSASQPANTASAQQLYNAAGITGAFASNPTVTLAANNPPRCLIKLSSVP